MDPGPMFIIDTSFTVTCLLAANHYLPHHTFNPLLQQIGELDNLTDSLGQSLEFVLCRSPRCLQHLCDVSFLLLVRLPRFLTEGKLAAVLLHTLLLGFPTKRSYINSTLHQAPIVLRK